MPFDPEGKGYDYETAEKYGIKPDETGHWQSREPKTGLLLKGRGHETWHKTVEGEKEAGYKIFKKGGRYYSMPIDAKKLEDQPAGIANQGVNNQLGNPEDDISNGYLEKRTIHEELNSPLMRALSKYGGETKETVPRAKGEIKGKGTPKGQPGFIPAEDIPEHQRLYGEDIGPEEPWIDPVSAFAGGFGGVFKTGISAGAKLAPTFFRAMTAGAVGTVMDYPIGAATGLIEEKKPGLALPFNVITGMVSGATVENAIEKGVMKYFTKKGIKPAQALIDETIKTVGENLKTGKIADEATKEVNQGLIEEVKKVPRTEWTAEQKKTLDPVLEDLIPTKAEKDLTSVDKLMIQRKRVLVEVKGIQEKVDKFLTTDISDLPEKAININFSRIETEDDIKAVIAKTADIFSEDIQDARRGVISNEQTEKTADMMGMSVEQLLFRRKGQAFNAETAVASRKILVSSASRLNDLAQKVASRDASDLDKFAFQKQLSIHYAIQAEVSGMTAEAGRALQSFKITSKESPGALKQIDEVMKSLGQRSMKDPITGKQMKPEDIADLLISIDSIEGINIFTRQIRKATGFDMILEAWINGLLSGPQTHAVNMTSNMLTAFWQVPERFLAAKIGRYLPGPQEIQEREALYQAWGLVQGFKDGMKAFTKNMITGEESDQFMKMDLPQRRAIASQNFGIESGSVAARAVDLLGEGIRIPTRFLGAEDAFFKSVGYRMELNARAFRQATSEGLEGKALSKRINEIIADPPDDIKLASVDAANYQTFTRELGEGGRAGMKFLSKNPALRLIIPFVRTPANIVKFMGERTPLALASKNIRADIAAGGATRDLALARISMGSMIMATVATMTSAGLITGGGPEDPTLKSIKRNTGWQPYSLKINDKYYSYNRLEPIGMLFGVAADTAEILGQVEEDDAKTLALAGVMAFAKNVTSKTWLRGMSEAISALADPERYGEKFIQNYARSLVPTGVAQIARTQDPVARSIYHPDGFWYETYNSIKSRVPGWSKSLPPRRNLWGEPIVLEGGLGPDIMSPVYTSTERYSPIDNELVRLKYGARMPETTQKIVGVDIPMTAKEYDQYLQVMNNVTLPQTGMNLKKSLDNLVTKNPMYKMQKTDDDKIDLIRQYISTAKKWTNGPLGIYEKNRKIREDVDNARFRLQREARKK